MERDFLGLGSKESFSMVREEASSDGSKEIGSMKGSAMQWTISNKVSTLPHLMSFKVGQEEKTKKIESDPLVPSGFISVPSADAHSPFQKPDMAEMQKSFNQNRQGGTQLSLTAYPMQHDVHTVHHPCDVKMFPVPNHAISISMGNPFFNNHYATSGQNTAAPIVKPQLLGGIPITSPNSILPTTGSVFGMTELHVKAAGPSQLTIFYDGAVNVYDNISPEKAQAIMFLAGNGSSVTSNSPQPKVRVQATSSNPAATDANLVNQPATTPPASRHSSPLSVSSPSGAQSGSGSTSTEEIMAAKTTGLATTSVSKLEPPKLAGAMGSIAATTMIPSVSCAAVPQARKASLARFLEKRKERVMNAAPYNINKKSPEFATEPKEMNLSSISAEGTHDV